MLPIQRCLDNRSRSIKHCACDVFTDVRNTTVMLRGSINMGFQVRVGSEDHKNVQGPISEIARNLRHNQCMTKFVLAGSQKRLSMITQIIEGQGWHFSP